MHQCAEGFLKAALKAEIAMLMRQSEDEPTPTKKVRKGAHGTPNSVPYA